MKKLLPIATTAILIMGCGEKVYDSEYYAAHTDEAKAVLEQCKAGKVSGDNCKNASEGIGKAMIKGFADQLKQ